MLHKKQPRHSERCEGRKKKSVATFVLLFLAICATASPSKGTPPQDLKGWKTNTRKHSIDLSDLMSGGPQKDGIPALTEPRFVPASEASRWLKPKEPVIVVVLEGQARAYPLQILIWHEIVNDRIGSLPIAVTFCPLCYSALVFDRRVGDKELRFGVSGLLHNSDMVMYDRETESLWQQFTGEAIVGDFTGTTLQQIPAQIVSFEQFSESYNQGMVLSRETGYRRNYGRNPYVGYDDISQRPFLYRGKLDSRLAPMERLVTLSIGDTDKAYPYSVTKKLRAVNDEVGGQPIVIFHAPGAVSALDQDEISASRQVGSTGVFDRRLDGLTLTFAYQNGQFADQETNSAWNVTGQAVEGKLKGRTLRPIPHGDSFAFAWLAFKPSSEIYRRK